MSLQYFHILTYHYRQLFYLYTTKQWREYFIKAVGPAPIWDKESLTKRVVMLSFLLLIFSILSPLTSCNNLALTYNAASSTCTAAYSTCSDSNATSLISKNENNTSVLEQVFNTTKKNAADIEEMKQNLDSIAATLSRIKNTTTSNDGTIDNLQLLLEDLLMLHNSSTFSPLPTSCQEIKRKQPNSPSGVYLLAVKGSETTKYVYCHMEELCGSGGGWTRLAYLNMNDSTENCPSGFRLYQSGGVRVCGRAYNNDYSCQSVQFPSNGISYSQVCGRVVGYQFGSPDAVLWLTPKIYNTDPKHNDINSAYVDGVSITRGSPRQHVWTLMAGPVGSVIGGQYNCPCSTGSTQGPHVQSFVNKNYYCESGVGTSWSYKLYTSDPLWDGKGCGTVETACCSAPGLPWFHRDYGNTTTTDYLELRVCGDEGTDNEDSPVSFYEIYVK